MGFLQAVYALGEQASEAYKNSPLADIMDFLQLPYPFTEDNRGMVRAIRVWLEVADPKADVLDIKGISHIDWIEYRAIGADEVQIKERCLYRDPVGSNVSWRFSPLYKLGKGSKEPRKELISEKERWENDKDCRFYKLYHNVLKDYENTGYFTEGSTNAIMSGLVAQVDQIAEFWSDRKIPCFLLFGLNSGGRFIYPGETPAFVKYFKAKLKRDEPANKGKKKQEIIAYCSICGAIGRQQEALDQVFKFATFDKPSFLPGTKAGAGVREKVFPVCEACYAVVSAGKEYMENQFVNLNTIPNINLYVIPEIISDKQEYYRMAADFTKDFLRNGIRNEPTLFKILARHNDGLVYHFLFAETNQAQVIVHFLVEDVPPSRLRKLQKLWEEVCVAFGYEDEDEGKTNNKTLLDTAIRQIVAVLMSLAGKREQDQRVMKDKVIDIISKILSGELVGVQEIKALVVSRLAGLINDPDWLKPKGAGQMPGRLKIKGMAEVVEFLYRVNGRGSA